MPLSVRKSICLVSMALAFSLTLGAVRAQKPAAVQIKKLDDNSSEVLRPIPAVLKNKAETPVVTKPLEKTKAAAVKNEIKEAAVKSETKSTVVKTETKSAVAKTETKNAAPKTETKSATATTDTKGAAVKDETKTTDKKADDKTVAVTKKTARAKSRGTGAHFVPPPPPNTPSIFNDSGDFASFNGVPIEMLSKEALRDRAKEISIQYKDACRELEDHSRQKDEKIQRAAEFDGLYKEGVVSRRELEASQKDAAEVNSDIDRLTFKAKELKGVLDRINKRLTQTVVKRNGHKLIN